MGVHDNHRERVKNRFRNSGLNGFEEHEVLELLLFYALPRVDTNTVAHELLARFGSLAGVLDAPEYELKKVAGVGDNAALLLSLMPQICRRYMSSKVNAGDILNTTDKAGKYLVPRFYGQRDEVLILVCLDAKCKVISCREIEHGSVNAAVVSIRRIVEYALADGATAVILAHNHTSGIAIPSREDEISTRRIGEALRTLDIMLIDHIVVADDDYVSMSESGMLK